MPVEIDENYTWDEKTRVFESRSGFSVTLPKTPLYSEKYDIGFTNTHQSIACDYPEATYYVGFYRIQLGIGASETQLPNSVLGALDSVRQELRGAAETSRTDLKIDVFPFAGSEGTCDRGFYRARAYFDHSRMDVFMQVVVGDRETVYSKASDEFFSSFKLRRYASKKSN